MYKDFFGLNRNPFELLPDPSFMYQTEKNKKVMASIVNAVENRKGFVVMTGEVGTGKTMIVRSLFDLWRNQGIAFANVFAPKLSVIDFLMIAAADLGIKVRDLTKGNLLGELYEFLLIQFKKGLTTVLVIDEAHQLSTNVLEEIRMLSNIETSQQKLVQVLLVGQPELDRKLDSFQLRQLKQRIASRCQLEPLSEEQTGYYIEHRLKRAGANSLTATLFPTETICEIYRYSWGIPRLVNNICDHALDAAFALQSRSVPVEIVEEIAFHYRLEPLPNFRQTEPLLKVARTAADKCVKTLGGLDVMKLESAPGTSLSHMDEAAFREASLAESENPSEGNSFVDPVARSGHSLVPSSLDLPLDHSTILASSESNSAGSVVRLRGTWRCDHILLETWPSRLRSWLLPTHYLSILICSAAFVAVALSAASILLRSK